jgi:hypothetical protein
LRAELRAGHALDPNPLHRRLLVARRGRHDDRLRRPLEDIPVLLEIGCRRAAVLAVRRHERARRVEEQAADAGHGAARHQNIAARRDALELHVRQLGEERVVHRRHVVVDRARHERESRA